MIAILLAVIVSISVNAQSTNSEIVGRVTDAQGQPLAGVTVEATHTPTGTFYTTVTNDSGRYVIPNMRVGGPYIVKVIQAGFNEQTRQDVQLSLGTAATINFSLSSAIDVQVTVQNDDIFSEVKTGASTNVSNEVISSLPTIGRQLTDFSRLTPQYGGNGSFAGQDNRLNNITVDGSYFNNSFGLAGQPGERTGVSPISLAAVEEFQVNVAPYDVRQGNFVGAAVNVVTKSGTNKYNGSAYYLWRNPSLVGKEAGPNAFNPGDFKFRTWGFTAGGPIPFFNFGEGGPMFISGKDKLFFFVNYEDELTTAPGTTWTACPNTTGSGCRTGNVTRVLASDLDTLANYLRTNFNYDPGAYQGYPFSTPGKKFLLRGDYNINDKNRLTLRYMKLDSSTDVLMSDSSSLGFGNRRTRLDALNFQNSNYTILENIQSWVGEWTSTWRNNVSNSLIVGYTKQDESRGAIDNLFPVVDILKDGVTYTSFGSEPFTPNNELRYKSFQIQDNLTFYKGSHTITTGLSYEKYESENVFFPGSQSAYVYNSLADFYADANGYLANPNRTTSPVSLRRFQVRWSNVPGLDKPVQPLEVQYVGFYGQDQWKLRDNFTLTYGLRLDVPFFGETGFTNPAANALTFRDETGASVQYQTQKLPDPNILWSPRAGFNWSPTSRLQVRGGTGLFSGRPAYVWISNQIGENGILTGFEQVENTTARPWNPNPDRYKPATVTGAPASSYGLAVTDPEFKFPQLWRSSIGVDYRLPWNLIAGTEFLHSKDVNGIYYINANLANPNANFAGADSRPRWTTSNRINSNITSNIVLKNQDVGKAWNWAATLEKPFSRGFYVKGAYSYGKAENTVDPGSIAFGSWNNNQHAGNPNTPGLGYSFSMPKHRIFVATSYRKEYFKFGATTVSAFWESRQGNNTSYVFGGDLNGDGGTSNDLIYIHKDISEMNFANITNSGGTVLFTPAQQAAAWDAYINQDPYLSQHRGEYFKRGGAFLPFVHRMDFSVAQDVFVRLGGQQHKFQLRADILNFGNLLNENWGGGQGFTSNQPLVTTSTSGTATCRAAAGAPAGVASYCLRTVGSGLLTNSFFRTAGQADVYRIQFGVRYFFN